MNNFLSFLLLTIIIISITCDPGWDEIHFEDDALGINRLFNISFEIYSKNNPNAKINFIERLATYKLKDDEKYYKIYFTDLKNKNFTIHQYTISFFFYQNETEINFTLIEKKNYYIIGRLAYNDARFTIFRDILCKEAFENNKEYPRIITSIDVIDCVNSFYFIITYRNYFHEEIIRIGRQNKENNEYKLFGKFID